MTGLTHKIICGDCIEVMKEMYKKEVNLILTDPPYGMNRGFQNDNLNNQEDFNRLWLSEFIKYFDCPILIWYKPASIDEIIVPAREVGLKLIDYFHLYKPNDIAFPRASWIRISESMMLFSKKRDIEYNNIKPYAHDTYIWNHGKKDKSFYHPSVKPMEVVMDIMRRIKADTVVDLFLGSGTTMVAAERLGRNSIGIEISKEYCELSFKRLSREVSQERFDKEPSVIERIGF